MINRLRAADTEYVVYGVGGDVVKVYRKRGSAVVYCNDHDGCVFEVRRISRHHSKD